MLKCDGPDALLVYGLMPRRLPSASHFGEQEVCLDRISYLSVSQARSRAFLGVEPGVQNSSSEVAEDHQSGHDCGRGTSILRLVVPLSNQA